MPWLEYLKTVTKTELPGGKSSSERIGSQMAAFHKWLGADAINRFYEFRLPRLSQVLFRRLIGKRRKYHERQDGPLRNTSYCDQAAAPEGRSCPFFIARSGRFRNTTFAPSRHLSSIPTNSHSISGER